MRNVRISGGRNKFQEKSITFWPRKKLGLTPPAHGQPMGCPTQPKKLTFDPREIQAPFLFQPMRNVRISGGRNNFHEKIMSSWPRKKLGLTPPAHGLPNPAQETNFVNTGQIFIKPSLINVKLKNNMSLSNYISYNISIKKVIQGQRYYIAGRYDLI